MVVNNLRMNIERERKKREVSRGEPFCTIYVYCLSLFFVRLARDNNITTTGNGPEAKSTPAMPLASSANSRHLIPSYPSDLPVGGLRNINQHGITMPTGLRVEEP